MSEIRLNAAACLLAKAIYYGRAQAFDLGGPLWEALEPATKAIYVNQAADIIKANGPCDGSALFNAMAATVRAQARAIAFAPSGDGETV